jgi:hypothetical protein
MGLMWEGEPWGWTMKMNQRRIHGTCQSNECHLSAYRAEGGRIYSDLLLRPNLQRFDDIRKETQEENSLHCCDKYEGDASDYSPYMGKGFEVTSTLHH